ncbi:MAG TPA: alpha/beta fold hydrolase [Acidimicrobiales bacterium]|nr:alpha/beta fold hydrolase [Acidimicrobiales bacterium]
MTRPRLTLLHGFTQTGRSFEPLLPELSQHFDVVAPDLPGHGTRSSAPAPVDEAVRLLAEEGGRGFWLGYSMGARVALRLALDHPELVDRLVLVSATAGIENADEQAARRKADEALAESLEAPVVPPGGSRAGADQPADASPDAGQLDAFLERWLAQPMFAGLSAEAAGMDARRENTAAGLAGALRLLGQGAFEPVWDRLLGLRMPVLVMAGERDDAYCEQALRLGAWIGERATLAMVPGAGHACHLEAPDAFLDLAVRFLSESQ